jgi:hypothetical protein
MSLCNQNIIPLVPSEELIIQEIKKDYGLYPINNISNDVNICTEIINAPTYTSNLTKLMTGLTESSIGVFNVSEKNMSFDYVFTGNLETLSAYTGDFRFEIYPRVPEGFVQPIPNLPPNTTIPTQTQLFDSTPSFSASTEFSGITTNGYSGSTLLINEKTFNLPLKDEEYVLNSNFSFVKKECFYRGRYTEENLGNEYFSGSSLYFVTLINPEVPILGPFREPTPRTPENLLVTRTNFEDINLGSENPVYTFAVPSKEELDDTCRFVNETLTIDPIDGSIFSITTKPSPNTLLVAVNGITLSESDYSISADTIIQLTQTLDPNRDIITASYLDCQQDLDTIYSEQYEILSAITSGVTSAVTTTDKVYYNTEQNKYEYYLDYNPTNPDTEMTLFLNGVKLTYGIDYYMSISVENRVIFNSLSLTTNDILYFVYASSGQLEGDYDIIIKENILEWKLINPTVVSERFDGFFNVEITESSDPNFTSTGVTTGITVNYINNNDFYSTPVPQDLEANKDYIWRVTSKKVYSGILDNIFITDSVSRVGKFSTNNKINSY